jgi:hypothetical protein
MTKTTDNKLERLKRELGFIVRVASDSEGGYEDLDAIARAAADARQLVEDYQLSLLPACDAETLLAA